LKKEKDHSTSPSSHIPTVSGNNAKSKAQTERQDLLLKKKKRENEINAKRLLGELYEDKKYFEMLKNDRG